MSLRLYEELEPKWVGSWEFFQVPGHLYYIQRFVLPSPRSNTWGVAQNVFKSHSLHGGRTLDFSKSYLTWCEAQNFFKPKSLYGGKAQNFYKSQSLFRGWKTSTTISLQVDWSLYGGDSQKSDTSLLTSPTGRIRSKRKLGIFPSPRAYIEGERSEFKSQSLGGSSEFFEVPESVWRGGGKGGISNILTYFLNSFIFLTYFFIIIFQIFLHIFEIR